MSIDLYCLIVETEFYGGIYSSPTKISERAIGNLVDESVCFDVDLNVMLAVKERPDTRYSHTMTRVKEFFTDQRFYKLALAY